MHLNCFLAIDNNKIIFKINGSSRVYKKKQKINYR